MTFLLRLSYRANDKSEKYTPVYEVYITKPQNCLAFNMPQAINWSGQGGDYVSHIDQTRSSAHAALSILGTQQKPLHLMICSLVSP